MFVKMIVVFLNPSVVFFCNFPHLIYHNRVYPGYA